MGFAVLIIIDILMRSRHLRAFYTDWGAFPRSVAADYYSSDWVWSLYMISGHWSFVAGMFAITIALAVALFFGYRTRLVAFLLWVLTASIHTRNPLILQSGDGLLRVMLFWSLFTPLGTVLALDSRPATPMRQGRVLSLATLAMTVQLLMMYVMTALLKTGEEWRIDGTAVYYALQLDQYSKPLGDWLLQFPTLLRFLTHATLAIEMLIPVLFLFPVFNFFTRTVGILLMIGFHLGITATLDVGLFSWIAVVALLTFLPTPVWNALEQVLMRQRIAFIRSSFALNLSAGLDHKGPGRKVFPKVRKQVETVLVGALLIYVCLWNIRALPDTDMSLSSDVGMALRLDQGWGMFAPKPATHDGWFVIPAQLRGGRELDLRTGEAVTLERPSDLSAMFSGERELKVLRRFLSSDNDEYTLHYGKYLCRNWNSVHNGDELLERFQIHYMREKTLPNYGIPEIEKVTIWRHKCFK